VAVTAAAATRTHRLQGGHLCCGEADLADILLEVGWRLGDDDLVASAYDRAGTLLAARRRLGSFPLNASLPVGTHVPGFMQGIAGLGYTFLRLADGEDRRFPSVLLLD
jgi:class II lanthipeptide synthase